MTMLIFDCDGVLADTERDGHRVAFNRMFAEFGLPVEWSVAEYGELLKIGGGKERMATLFGNADLVRMAALPTAPDDQKDLVRQWHLRKTAIYKEMVEQGKLPGRPGIKRVTQEALADGWRLCVASTSAEDSVRAVLDHAVGSDFSRQFSIFAGDIVPRKKPDPAIYHLAIEQTGQDPADAIVIEDSRNGLRAAVGAGLRCVVTVNGYTESEDFSEARMVVSSLGDPETPAVVIANRGSARPARWITVSDLKACLT